MSNSPLPKVQSIKDYDLIVFDVSGTLSPDFNTLYDGMLDVLKGLNAQGKKIALATNLSRSGLVRFVEEHVLEPYLSSYISATESAFKPNPDMLEIILIESDTVKEKTLLIGDTAQDVYMAQSIGVDSCAVKWDEGKWSSEILALNPTYTVSCMDDLKCLLKLMS